MKSLKFIAVGLATVFTMSCNQTPSVEGVTSGQIDSASYLLGVNYGMSMKQYGVKVLNMDELKAGFEAALNSKGNFQDSTFAEQFKIDPSKTQQIVGNYIETLRAKQAEKSMAAEKEYLETLKAKNIPVTADGVYYEVEDAGSTRKILPTDTVSVIYKGSLIDGTVFDQVKEGQKPVRFALNQVIRGWQSGLAQIGEGGSIKLYIPSSLGYGSRANGTIPAYSTLLFDVKVVSVSPAVEKKAEVTKKGKKSRR